MVKYTWQGIIEQLAQAPAGALARIPTWQIEHPLGAGMTHTVGWPIGQRATYRWQFDALRALSVNDFGTHYDAQLIHAATFPLAVQNVPSRSPALIPVITSLSPLESAVRDSPGATVLAATALGALFGAFTGSKNGVATGALLGGIAGLAAVAIGSAEHASETAQLAQTLLAELADARAKNEKAHAQRAALLAMLAARAGERTVAETAATLAQSERAKTVERAAGEPGLRINRIRKPGASTKGARANFSRAGSSSTDRAGSRRPKD